MLNWYQVIQGLDLAIPLMDLEEEAELIVGPRFAFGSEGRKPDIPPDATLNYTVILVDAEPEPFLETLPLKERKEVGLVHCVFLFLLKYFLFLTKL